MKFLTNLNELQRINFLGQLFLENVSTESKDYSSAKMDHIFIPRFSLLLTSFHSLEIREMPP